MRSRFRSRFGVATLAVISLSVAGACQRNNDGGNVSVASASGDSVAARVDSAGGEVSNTPSAEPVAGRWITDANVLSLLGTMNAAQIAAADVELQGWHSDSVRAFAASVARGSAEMQHSVDSLAGRMNMVPIAPALAEQLSANMRAQIDSMRAYRGGSLDRAFLIQQMQGQRLMADYVTQLSGVAERPELQALLSSAAGGINSQAARAQLLLRAYDAADSAAAVAPKRR
jgi:predicted outer membrane protein